MSSGLVRCFVAFDVDDEKVLGRLAEVQRRLVETGADLRFVEPENVHVTLRFLGEVEASAVEGISRVLDEVSFAPFDFELRGVGVFPGLRRINVVWMGIGRGVEELRKIFDGVEGGVVGLGLKGDRRGFSPHVTIARVRSARGLEGLRRGVLELEGFEFGVVRAEALKLFRSVLTPLGPVYSVLHEVRR